MFKKYVTFSYDDGLEQDKRLIELMKQYGLKGTFNLNAGLFGKRDYIGAIGSLGFTVVPEDTKRKSYLKYVDHFVIPEDEIAQVYEGFEVASHGYRHETLAFSTRKVMRESINLDLENLERIVGRPVTGFAYARGLGSKAAQKYLREKGILFARSIKSTGEFSFPNNPWNYQPTCSQIDKNVFEVIDRFLSTPPTEEDQLLYIWGHGYECDLGTERASWKRTEQIFEKIAGRKGLSYCTNSEAFQAHHENLK